MSDTPFTDSRTYGFTDEDGIHCEAVHADFARKLERERDELRSWARVWKRAAKDWRAISRVWWRKVVEMKRERDEAREALKKATETLHLIADEGGSTHDTEYGPLSCNGFWCGEQARTVLYELEAAK